MVLLAITMPALQGFSVEQSVYYVELGLYQNPEKALNQFSKLLNKNIAINIDSFGEFYRVVSGYYKTYNDAVNVANEMQKLGINNEVKATKLTFNKHQSTKTYYVLLKSYELSANIADDFQLLKSYNQDFKLRKKSKIIELYVDQFYSIDEANNKALELNKLGFNCSIIEGSLNKLVDYRQVQELNNGESLIKNFILKEDQVLKGLYGSYSMFFYKNKNWSIINKPYFDLKYQRNQITQNRNSTITVLLNSKPVYSEITQDTNNIRVYFEPDEILNGYNTVTIKCFNRISDLPCEDDLNPANWLKVKGTSYVNLNYLNIDDKTSISDFPYPYIIKGVNQPLNMKLMIPPKASEEELSAAAMFSVLLGMLENEYDSNIDFVKYHKDINLNDNLVLICKRENLPNEYQKYFTNKELQTSDNSLIKEIYSPYNVHKKMLIILLGNSQSYEKLLINLKDSNVTKQIIASSYKVDANTVTNELTCNIDSKISLNKMGYVSTYVEGLFNHNLQYDFRVPASWQPTGDVEFNLHLRYSDILDFSKSVVTILVNGVPIGSKSLKQEKANDNFINFVVTKDSLSSLGSYNINVQLSLYIKDTYCETRENKNVWAYIANDSFINFPYSNNPNITISKYEALFIENESLNNTNIILPTNPTTEEISTALRVSNYLGKYTKSIGNIGVVLGSIPSTLSGNNIVIYNNENAGSLVKESNKYAFVKYSEANKMYEPTPKIALHDTSYMGSIQILPYKNETNLLLINAKNEYGLKQVKTNLINSKELRLMNGDVTIINKQGGIKTAIYNKKLQQYLANEYKDYKAENKNGFKFKLNFSSMKVIVIILSIMIITIATFVYLKRNK